MNNRLWIMRVKRGLPRKKVAAWLGHRSASQLCRWEAGGQVPSLQTALVLSHLLQMPVEFLFRGLRDELVAEVERRLAKNDDPLWREPMTPIQPNRYEPARGEIEKRGL